MSSLGVFSNECSSFLDMMNDIGIDKKQQHYIIKKMINIAIRATYYIFCCRNRYSDRSDFFLHNSISSSQFVNCLYVARLTIVHSKRQIKFLLLLLLLLLLYYKSICINLFILFYVKIIHKVFDNQVTITM